MLVDEQKGQQLIDFVPRILVVLPTLGDRIDTLEETLKSVELQKKDVSLNLVVVAPKEAELARKIATKYGAQIVDDPKTGISEAINCGIRARTSETYYAWIGDDDLFRPGGLKTLIGLLKANPQSIVAYGGCEYIDSHGKVLGVSRAGKLAQMLLSWGPDLIPHPGSIISLDYLEKAGLFDVNLKYAMDLDMFLKLKKMGPFVYTKKVVSAFRWHAESLTVANRLPSSLESEKVKFNHLSAKARPFSFLWVKPLRFAASVAANALNRRA